MIKNPDFSINQVILAPTSEFPRREFRITKEIGWGGEGRIFEAEAREWKKEFPNKVAIKTQQRFNQNEEKIVEDIMKYQEKYECQQSNKQPSQLIKIYDLIKLNSEQAFVMEVGENNLHFFLKNNNPSFQRKLKIMIQLSQSIAFFHQELKSIHRDIKPENFIQIGEQFKLIDFGTVRYNIDCEKTVQIGTILYQAPEIVECQSNYTEAVDIWSLGCVFYEFFGSQTLFDGKNHYSVKNLILSSRKDQKFLKEKINSINEDEGIKNILFKMLEPEFKQRISINLVLNMLKELLQQQSPSTQKPNLNPNFLTQIPNFQNQAPKFLTQSNCIEFKQIVNNSNQNNIYQQTQLNQFILNFQNYQQQHLQQSSQTQGKLTQLQNLFEKSLENQEQNKINMQQEFKQFQYQFQTNLSNELDNYFKKINTNLQAENIQIVEQKNGEIKELNIKVEQLSNQVSQLQQIEKSLLNQMEKKDQEFQEYFKDQQKKDYQQFMEIFQKIIQTYEENTQKQEQSCQEYKMLNQQMKDTITIFQNIITNPQTIRNEKSVPNLNSQFIYPPQNNYNQQMLNVSKQNRQTSQSCESGIIDQNMYNQKHENIIQYNREQTQLLKMQIQDEISKVQQLLQHDNYIDITENINTLNNIHEQFMAQFKNLFSTSYQDYKSIIEQFKIKILDLKEQCKGQYQNFSSFFYNLSEELTENILNLIELKSCFEEKVSKYPKGDVS